MATPGIDAFPKFIWDSELLAGSLAGLETIDEIGSGRGPDFVELLLHC
jgi:hypothetical protein